MKQLMTPPVTLLLLLIFCIAALSTKATADELKLNGIASFNALNQEIYVAALYLEQPASTEQQVLDATGKKRMEFRISRDKWYKRSFTKTWARAITINNDTPTQEALAKYIVHFSHIPDGPLLYGDTITIDHKPNVGSTIKINGVTLLTIKKPKFFNTIVKAWIGKRPPSSDFKQRILTLDVQDITTKNLIERFKYIEPIDIKSRVKTVRSWR